MADSGKQSPLGINVLSSLLQNTGLCVNPVMAEHVGAAISETGYTLGSLCNDTCLQKLTLAINAANGDGIYPGLITIGSATIPALGNSPPSTFTWSGPANTGDPTSLVAQAYSWNPYTGDITTWGYLRLLALQARHEANYNDTFKLTGEYRDFLSSFMTASSFIEYSNSAIAAVQNSMTFLDGTYSNMNDLISSDILGVNLSSQSFGQDLIDLGKAIDLSSIDTFGLPSKLFLTLQKYNAITPSLTLALLAAGLSQSEISTIGSGTPTVEQENKIYGAYTIIAGQDLFDILVPLNCKTTLATLADLLNIRQMFPRSYSSMTVSVYNTTNSNTNSKIYYPIYVDGALNPNLTSPAVKSSIGSMIPISMPSTVTSVTNPVFTPQEPDIGFGSSLYTILPMDIAIAAGAFSVAMMQIKNITSVPVEKFAQAVVNLETINGLSVNGTSVPTNSTLAAPIADMIALGSGPQGTYTMSDFFGCMSGLPYDVTRIQTLILQLQTPALVTIYQNLYNEIMISGPNVGTYISAANTEIGNIQTRFPGASAELNALWDATGTQLTLEQQARSIGFPPVPTDPRSTQLSSFPMTQYSFVDSIPRYALNTSPNMYAQTLEAISNMTTVGGQSIVAMMRQERNQARLSSVGIPLDNNIPGVLPTDIPVAFLNQNVSATALIEATAITTLTGDAVSTITITDPGAGYLVPPIVIIASPDVGNTATATATLGPAGVEITLDDGGSGYTSPPLVSFSGGVGTTLVSPSASGVYDPTNNTYYINGQPVDTGEAIEPGSLSGSPYTRMIPPNLNTLRTSGVLLPASQTPSEAIGEVTVNNCDCWTQP